MQRQKVVLKIVETLGKENIKSITPYVKAKLDLSLEVYASINSPKIEGSFEIVGQYPSYPLAFSFRDATYFDKEYEPTTYKEFLHDYDSLENMIVVNSIVNKGFAPQVSANRNEGIVTLYSSNSKINQMKFVIGAYLRDYKKEATIYTSANFLNSLQNSSSSRVNGFAINLHSNDIAYLNLAKERLNILFEKDYQTLTWLDKNKKQYDLINLYEMLSNMIQALILIATSSAILLLIFRTLLSIQPQIRSLYLMGYNVGVSTIVMGSFYLLLFSGIGVALGLLLLSYRYTFSISFLLESGFAQRLLLVESIFITVFVIGVALIFNIKKVEIK